jgi:hypothetical protein
MLSERKALLIETTEDTTQPDPARRSGLIELLVIVSILRKLRLRDLASTGASAKRLGAAARHKPEWTSFVASSTTRSHTPRPERF